MYDNLASGLYDLHCVCVGGGGHDGEWVINNRLLRHSHMTYHFSMTVQVSKVISKHLNLEPDTPGQ